MTISEPFEEDIPNLELQTDPAPAGPRGPGRTAVGGGLYDDDSNSETFVVKETPEWFGWVIPLIRTFTRYQLIRSAPKYRRLRCEKALLTNDELTVLNLRLHLNLNLDHPISGDATKHFTHIESDLERQSLWKLWSYTLWLKGNIRWLDTIAAWGLGLLVIWFLHPFDKSYSPFENLNKSYWYTIVSNYAMHVALTIAWTAVCYRNPFRQQK